ncbi:bidirectional sugar transporter SWEET5 [Sesamum indicum]|uniref:Bidirectional sugar transporter SWEET n=1 Tax=Sesamum indicum TaxID=4182 RepID=A0A6I9SWC5_SESIN|nr:bidirectional sugar transporter SWEET5 [Sesamum indicum]
MADPDTVRTIIGIIGNVISFFLFLSPMPTFYRIWKEKSVQSFKPDPYIATVLNCAMWVLYGLPIVHPDSLLVITINGTGFFIEVFYLSMFITFSDWAKRRKMFIALLLEAIFFAIVVVITLIGLHGTKSRSLFVGILCVIFNIMMYASPLTVMKRVIKTKSVKYMPFSLSLANFANGIVWSIYALIKLDPFVLVPNGLGTLSGLVQLVLFATYYRTTKWGEEEETNKQEIELQKSAETGQDGQP